MRLLKKALPVLFLTPIISSSAMAAETCLKSYLGYKFQVAQIDYEKSGVCIYSASAIYPLNGKLKPILEWGSRWREGHGGWYCRPSSGKPRACRFKAIN